MELATRPEDLHAAALALARCTVRLDDTTTMFAQRAQLDVPDLGVKSVQAGAHAVAATLRAVEVISSDITKLSQALAGLAEHYRHVDSTAMPRR
jgi:hypothetical protein